MGKLTKFVRLIAGGDPIQYLGGFETDMMEKEAEGVSRVQRINYVSSFD